MNTDLIIYPILLIIGAVLIIGLAMFTIHIYRLYKQYKYLYIDYERLCENLDKENTYFFNIIYKGEILNHFKPVIRRGTIKEEIVTFAEYRYDLKTKKSTLYAKRKNPITNKLKPVRVDLCFQEEQD